MIAFPHTKINLGLHVSGKRNDGYHNIETCFYPLPWCDVLEIIRAETISFTNSGLGVPGKHEDNLCLRAYYLLRDKYDLPPVAIHLHKVVPLGAGLGGGSSDGAYTLKMLNHVFDLALNDKQLIAMAAELGSDCPFFIYDWPMHGSGRGEVLSPANVKLNGKFIAVVKPSAHISTAEAFKNLVPRPVDQDIKRIVEQRPVSEWRELLTNDFEPSVFSQHPEIQEIKSKMYDMGALYASMSGSGSAVFGIFEKARAMRDMFSGMTYWSGVL